jgi:hypothetical protein
MKEMGWLPKLQAAASALLVFISCMSGHAQGRCTLCVARPVEDTAHCSALMRCAKFYSRLKTFKNINVTWQNAEIVPLRNYNIFILHDLKVLPSLM